MCKECRRAVERPQEPPVGGGPLGEDERLAARARPRSRPYAPAARAADRPSRWPLAQAAAVALLIGLPVAFRGLYFEPQQLLTLIAASGVAVWVWWSRARDGRALLRGYFDIAALAVPAVYLLAVAVAVYPDLAVLTWLQYLLYFLVFWCVSETAARSAESGRIVRAGLYVAAAIVACSGVAGGGGAFAARDFFAGGRMYTTIQYPDAAAAMLAGVAFVAMGAQVREHRTLQRALYRALVAGALFAFVFALSRGAVLVFAPVAILYVAAMGRRGWVDAAASLVLPLAGVAAGAVLYEKGLVAVSARRPVGGPEVWAGFVVALVVAAALGWVADRCREGTARVRIGAGVAAAVVAAAGLGLGLRHFSHRTGGLLGRITHINLQTYNAWSRLQWAHDALRLVGLHPLLGLGGGGWQAAYRMVQSYFYSSTQVHNGWIQIWVETGTLGLLLWCAFWVLLLGSAWRAWRHGPPDRRPLVVGLTAGAVMIGAHAAIDFTLSLSAVSIVLWAMAGMLRTASGPPDPADARAPGAAPVRPVARGRRTRVHVAPRARQTPAEHIPEPAPTAPAARGPVLARGRVADGVFTAVAALVAVFALVLWTGTRRMQQGSAEAGGNNLQAAAAAFRAATADDPWSAEARFDLAQTESTLAGQMRTGSSALQSELAQADQDYRATLALDPYGFLTVGNARVYYAYFLQRTGRPAQAVQQATLSVAQGPYVASNYDALDLFLVEQAVGQARSHHLAASRATLARVGALARQRAARARAVPPQALAALASGQAQAFPATDAAMELAAGETAGMQGRWSQAVSTLTPVAPTGGTIGGEAALWLGLVQERLGQAHAHALATAAADLGSAYNQQVTIVRSVLGIVAPAAKPK